MAITLSLSIYIYMYMIKTNYNKTLKKEDLFYSDNKQ